MTIGTGTSLFTRKTSGGAFNVEDQGLSTGDRYFVDSEATNAADATNGGSSPDVPFRTVDFAISQTTENQGDIIFVMPGHHETGSTENVELWDLDKAGVSIVGIGEGDHRPTFTLKDDGATCVLGAANTLIRNLRFIGSVTDLAAMIDVEAVAIGSTIEDCYFADSATGLDAITVLAVVANADRLTIQRNFFSMITGGEATSVIDLAGGSDGTIIRENVILSDCKTEASISGVSAASAGIIIIDNFILNNDGSAGLGVKLHNSSSGFMSNNAICGGLDNTKPYSTVAALHLSHNFLTDIAGAAAIVHSTVTAW